MVNQLVNSVTLVQSIDSLIVLSTPVAGPYSKGKESVESALMRVSSGPERWLQYWRPNL